MISDPLAPWIILTGSLTTALRAVLTKFHVQVLSETFQDDYWQRDVFLCDDSKPYVFARTQLLASSPLLPIFQNLGTRPVGEWLYAQPDLKKDPFQALAQTEVMTFLGKVPHPIEFVYTPGRYTRYWVQNQPIEITELFLDIPPCP